MSSSMLSVPSYWNAISPVAEQSKGVFLVLYIDNQFVNMSITDYLSNQMVKTLDLSPLNVSKRNILEHLKTIDGFILSSGRNYFKVNASAMILERVDENVINAILNM